MNRPFISFAILSIVVAGCSASQAEEPAGSESSELSSGLCDAKDGVLTGYCHARYTCALTLSASCNAGDLVIQQAYSSCLGNRYANTSVDGARGC